MGAAFQAGQIMGLKPLLPAVEGLGTDTVVPAGKPGVLVVRFIEIEPLESQLGFFRDIFYLIQRV